jgi:hypothetical protein
VAPSVARHQMSELTRRNSNALPGRRREESLWSISGYAARRPGARIHVPAHPSPGEPTGDMLTGRSRTPGAARQMSVRPGAYLATAGTSRSKRGRLLRKERGEPARSGDSGRHPKRDLAESRCPSSRETSMLRVAPVPTQESTNRRPNDAWRSDDSNRSGRVDDLPGTWAFDRYQRCLVGTRCSSSFRS